MAISYSQVVRQFGRNVYLYLLIAALLGFTYDGGIYSVLFNLYLLRLDLGPEVIGQVNSLGMLAFAVSAFPAGAVGHWLGSRAAMLLGCLVMFIGSLWTPLAALVAPSWQLWQLIIAYILLNAGLALFYVNATPYLTYTTRTEDRNYVFSVQSAVISLAGFAGGLLAGFLPGYFASTLGYTLSEATPYRYPLLLAAGLIAVGGVVMLKLQDAAPRVDKVAEEKVAQPEQGIWAIFWLLAVLAFVRFLIVSGSSVVMTFFNVYLDAGLGAPTATIGMLIAAGRLLAAPAALITPLLVGRLGNARVTLYSSLALALCLVPVALSTSWGVAGLGYIGAMALTSIRYPAFTVYTMAITPAGWRAAVSGAGEMAAGLSFACIALLGGYLIAFYGFSTLFFAGALLSIGGAAVLWLFMQGRKE